MENLPNPLEILLRIEQMCIDKKKRDDRFEKRLEAIEKKLNIKIKSNEFNIKTIIKAAEFLDCSKDILRAAIKNGILIEGIDYRYNGRRTYTFSEFALQKHKGKL